MIKTPPSFAPSGAPDGTPRKSFEGYMKSSVIWVLVNCNSFSEAKKIGAELLRKRLASCFDIFDRRGAWYFWPPRSGKIEQSKGCLLIIETRQQFFNRVDRAVRALHSDRLPFVGSLVIGNVHPRYLRWMKGELRRR